MADVPLWFAGICDSLYRTVHTWAVRWETGEVAATRTWIDEHLQPREIATKRACRVNWRKAELQHLVRILQFVRPEWPLTADMTAILDKFDQTGRLLVGGVRQQVMVCYQQDPVEILQVLDEVRSGKATTRNLIDEQLKTGKLW